ncbi:MAG TPA: Uma2 family endonuclease [Chloroflexota bacterium]|jgi:Uma2 family endonuclease|nr:Uma2 family endonuclease [Chloroflexota bacterium]
MHTTTVLLHEDYLRLPEDDPNKYEMLWGELHMAPSPRFTHQEIQAALIVLLGGHVRERGLGTVVGPIDLYRDEVNYVQPDISYFTAAQLPLLGEQQIRQAPPLTVEILSPSTATTDREDKRRWYAELGVREYWLVDPLAQRVEVIDLTTNVGLVEDPVRSIVLPDLVLPLAEIFA